ncbi:MAG: translation elongation factor-like protein [Candidatus Micrarchaeota archaeon]
MEKKPIGVVTHYFDKIGVGVIELDDSLKVGDKILVQASPDFEQTVDSMQIDTQPITEAEAGQAIGLKLKQRARHNDKVFLLG